MPHPKDPSNLVRGCLWLLVSQLIRSVRWQFLDNHLLALRCIAFQKDIVKRQYSLTAHNLGNR